MRDFKNYVQFESELCGSMLLIGGFEGSSVGFEAHFLAVVPVPLADLVVGHANFLGDSHLVGVCPNRACLVRLKQD